MKKKNVLLLLIVRSTFSTYRVPLRRGRKIDRTNFWAPKVLLSKQTPLFFLFLTSTGSNMHVRGKESCDSYMKMYFLKIEKLTYQSLWNRRIKIYVIFY
jgi:hypothetical protein